MSQATDSCVRSIIGTLWAAATRFTMALTFS